MRTTTFAFEGISHKLNLEGLFDFEDDIPDLSINAELVSWLFEPTDKTWRKET